MCVSRVKTARWQTIIVPEPSVRWTDTNMGGWDSCELCSSEKKGSILHNNSASSVANFTSLRSSVVFVLTARLNTQWDVNLWTEHASCSEQGK